MDETFVRHILHALVTGYVAREGVKDRYRSLNEYEIARRAGVTAYSYVAYDESDERAEVRRALSVLERQGLVTFVRPVGRYDAFAPTEQGTLTVTAGEVGAHADHGQPAPEGGEEAFTEGQRLRDSLRLEQQLAEIIHLLRSIDRRLEQMNS